MFGLNQTKSRNEHSFKSTILHTHTANRTRNVGTPKCRPTWWPPPPSKWYKKFYGMGNSTVVTVGLHKIFGGWV